MSGPSFRALATPAALLAAGLFSTACGGDGDGPTDPDPSAVAEVEVSPASATLTALGDTQQFEATARDASGSEVSGVTFTWSSSDPDVATVDSDGTAVARAEGTVTIEAEARGETGTADLTVDQEAARLEISPDSASFELVGDTQRFEAEATDANGNPLDPAALEWRSSDTTVARVDSTGLATAWGGGEASVVVVAGAVADSAPVDVQEQPFSGDPDRPANEVIPDRPFPEPDTSEFVESDGVKISTRNLTIMLSGQVTVREANRLFLDLEGELLGGLPDARLLYVRFPDRTAAGARDFADSLAATQEVVSAVLDFAGGTMFSLPTHETRSSWHWSSPDTAGNWWASEIRAPQLWNLGGMADGGRPTCAVNIEGNGPDADGHPALPAVDGPDADNDHATMTTGLMAAVWGGSAPAHGVPSTGVDRVLSRPASSFAVLDSHVVNAIAANQGCSLVFGYSWGDADGTNKGGDAVTAGERRTMRRHGAQLASALDSLRANMGGFDALFVAAAGNNPARPDRWNSPILFLADSIGRIYLSVGATDSAGGVANRPGWGSSPGGETSAPGVCVRSTESDDDGSAFSDPSCPAGKRDGGASDDAAYGTSSGTSFAAPQVAGLALMLWELDDELTPVQVRRLLTRPALTRSVAGGPPRVDAFAAALGIDGLKARAPVQRALVDVDDGTRDGHLRSKVYPEDPSPGSFHTDDGERGDGRVDMADLRVFRDAWTQLHVHADERELDGGDAHPWKDLNRDGCVGSSQALGLSGTIGCGSSHGPVTPEARFPRFDFNGNGYIHRAADRVRSAAPDSALAPFKVDPDNACASAAAGCLRDLDVLEQTWEGAAARENVNAAGTEEIACTEPPSEEWNPTALTADRDDNGSVDYMHSFDVHFRVPGGAVVPPEEDDEDLLHAETFPFDDGTPNGTFASYNLHGADRLFVKCRFEPAENAEVSVPVAETGPGFNYVIWQGANDVTDDHRAREDESTYNWIKIGFEPKHGEDFGFGAIYDSDLGMESTSRGLSDDWFVVAREVIFRDRSDPGDNTEAYDVWDTAEGTISSCLRTEAKSGEAHADTPFHQAMEEKANQVWVETSEARPVSLLKQWVGKEKVVTALPIASYHDPAACSDAPGGFTRQKGKLWGVWLQVNSVE